MLKVRFTLQEGCCMMREEEIQKKWRIVWIYIKNYAAYWRVRMC